MNHRAACAVFALGMTMIASSASGQEYYRSEALARDSAYHTNGNAFFLRGGYVFDSTEEDFDDFSGIPGLEDLGDTSSVYGSLGVRNKLIRAGASMFALEVEALVARDTVDFDDGLGNFLDFNEWIVAPQISGRWQYNFHGRIAPFASVGVGPAIVIDSIESSIGDVSDTSVFFSYNGRAGLEINITPRFGMEAAYRYLGVTDETTAGFHAGEIGFNFKF